MTVESTTSKVVAAGNGVATTFSFSPMVIFESSDLVVVKTDTDGVESTLTETTDYTVTVADYPGTGSITYPATGTTKLATGETLTIKRVLPIEQDMALNNQGGYFADTQETAFDKLTMIALQLQEAVDRSLKLPVSDADSPIDLPTAENRAGKALVFDADGQPTAGALSDVAVSAPMTPVVQAATLAAAFAALGVSTFAQTLLDDADAATARATLGVGRGALLELTANESIGNSTAAAVPWDAATYDTDSFWASGTPKRLTIPAGVSKVRVSAHMCWASNSTGARNLAIKKNGATFKGMASTTVSAAVSDQGIAGAHSAVVDVVAGDYFELEVLQTSGGALNLASDSRTWFAVEVVK